MQKPRFTRPRIFLALLILVLLGGAYLVLAPTPVPTPKETKNNAPVAAIEENAAGDAQLKQYLLQHYGGESHNSTQSALVTRVATAITTHGDAKDSKKTFHAYLLAEPNIIDTFAAPNGEVYITTALVNRMRTEGELAAAIAGGVAHVLAGDRMLLAANAQPHFTNTQETAADARAIKLMAAAGYDPEAMIGMFRILMDAYHAGANVAFFTTHPSTEDRLAIVNSSIKALYPNGIPAVLSK